MRPSRSRTSASTRSTVSSGAAWLLSMRTASGRDLELLRVLLVAAANLVEHGLIGWRVGAEAGDEVAVAAAGAFL